MRSAGAEPQTPGQRGVAVELRYVFQAQHGLVAGQPGIGLDGSQLGLGERRGHQASGVLFHRFAIGQDRPGPVFRRDKNVIVRQRHLVQE